MFAKKTFLGIGIFIFLFGIFLFVALLAMNYDEFINYLMQYGNIAISKKEKIETVFPVTLFNYLRYILPIAISTIGILILYYSQVLSNFISSVNRNLFRLLLFFKALSKGEKQLLFAIIAGSFLVNIYNVINLPIFYDEAWTYHNFTQRGLFISLTKYPAPNNHVLHSVLTNLTCHFPFSTTVNLRIPNLITALFSSLIFFYTFAKMFEKKIAFLLLPIFCFVFGILQYAYLSRGYILVVFSFLICFYATMKLTSQNENVKNNRKYLIYLSVGGLVGFATMPSFLYPYFTCMSFVVAFKIAKKDFTVIKPIIISGIVTTILVILFYTPMLIVSGLNAIINNEYVAPISRLDVIQNLYSHFDGTFGFLFGIKLVFIPILFFSICYFIKNKTESSLFVVYCFLIAPVLLLIQSVLPFYRTWIYLTIPFLFGLGLVLKEITNCRKFTIQHVFALNVLFSVLLVVLFNYKIKYEQEFSFQANKVANYIMSHNIKKICCYHPIIEANLLYIFEENKKKIALEYSYEPLIENEIKTITHNCDLLITSKKLNESPDLIFINNWNSWEANTYLYKTK